MGQFFHADDVILIGRTFDEYVRLFGLENIDPAREVILDAAAGVSSFTAEANARGYHVTASDRVYHLDTEIIARKCHDDWAYTMAQMPPILGNYIWDFFPDVDALARQREKAYTAFLKDYRAHGHQCYIPTTYPKTDFADKQFTLTLMSHLFFLYEDILDYAFHHDTLAELLRITSREIRIFPLVTMTTQRSVYVEQLMHDPDFAGCTFEIVRVNYEFIRNGNDMLVIRQGV